MTDNLVPPYKAGALPAHWGCIHTQKAWVENLDATRGKGFKFRAPVWDEKSLTSSGVKAGSTMQDDEVQEQG